MELKNIPESEYSKKTSIEHRKQFAQFFTPVPIADLMARWLCGNKHLTTVLEPAFGLGVFSRLLLSQNTALTIEGFDIDEKIIAESIKLFGGNHNILISKQDYISSSWEKQYDGIICNPPYFKFHDYDNLTATAIVNEKLKIGCSGFTNLYAYFLVKSIHQLKPGGRCAYIIPSEFMNSDYGVRIKDYLLKSKCLRHIVVFDFSEQLFDDAITTSAILLCAKDENNEFVSFYNAKCGDDLKKVSQLISSYPCSIDGCVTYRATDIQAAVKWKAYYQPQNQSIFHDLVPFSTFAKVTRGIATGANDFFVFNKEKASKYKIPLTCLKPCICHCTDIPKAFFCQQDFNRLMDSNKNVFLFDGMGSMAASVISYIRKGEDDKCNERHLTRNRTPWYSLEKREPAPIWVSVFSRDKLRFVRNTSNATNLTTFHCIYPKNTIFDTISVDLLFAYLVTNTAHLIFLDNGREYGKGLNKFEPNDLNKGMMLDLRLLSDDEKRWIMQEFSDFQKGDELAVNRIDTILKNRFLR